MKRLLCLILALVLVFSLASCKTSTDPGTAADGEKKVKDTFVIAVDAEPILNPYLMGMNTHLIVGRQIYDSIVNQEDGAITPGLAESWEYTDDDMLTFRLHLRQGVKFHDGTEFTANDIKYFFEQIKDNASAASRWSAFDAENSVVVDDYTFDVKLFNLYAETLEILSSMYIPSSAAMQEMGPDEFANAPVGTGPFKLTRWDIGSEIELERFDDYWNGPAASPKILYRVIPEASSRVVELETGGVDMATNIGMANIARVEAMDNATVNLGPSTKWVFMTFCMTDPILSNQDARYALMYASDIKNTVAACYEGYAYTMNTMYPSMLFGARPVPGTDDPFPYDVEKAKELLAQAGYADGCEVTVWTVNDELSTAPALIAENQLTDAGFKVDLQVVDFGVFIDKVRAGEAGMWLLYNSSNIMGDDTINRYTSSMYPGSNWCGVQDEEYDKAVAEGFAATTEEAKLAAFETAQKRLLDLRVIYSASTYSDYALTQANITGLALRGDLYIDVNKVDKV